MCKEEVKVQFNHKDEEEELLSIPCTSKDLEMVHGIVKLDIESMGAASPTRRSSKTHKDCNFWLVSEFQFHIFFCAFHCVLEHFKLPNFKIYSN